MLFRPLQKMISIIQSRYRHILPSSKSCTPRALSRASPKGRTNYVTTEGSAPCTTSIIENGNRFCSRTRKMEILFCIGPTLLLSCMSSQKEAGPPPILEAGPPPILNDTLGMNFEPQWTEDEVFEHWEELIAFGIPNPTTFISMFRDLYDEGGTTECPGSNYNFDSPEVSNYGCTASTGMFFAGAAEFQRDTEDEIDMHCDCRIVAEDGRMVRGAGNFRVENHSDEIFLDIQGSFLATPSEPWLEELPSLQFTIWKTVHNSLNIEGGWTVNDISVYFDNFWSSECPNGEGSIFVRDPSGIWWEWRLNNNCSQELYFNDEFQSSVVEDTQVFIQQVRDVLEL
jgi:hypothetical protein